METASFYLGKVLAEMLKRNASSMHLSVGNLPTLKIDHRIVPLEGEDIVNTEMIQKIIDLYLDEKEKEKLSQKKALIAVKTLMNKYRFKVGIFYQRNMPSVSFHYIADKVVELQEIGLPSQFMQILNVSSGLIVVAGPFSSGKTTTSVSIIEEFNKQKEKHIITLEDPIEYLFYSKKCVIEQREIGIDVLSVKDGLSYSLNEDVGLVYIGENKDDMSDYMPLAMELASGNSLVILEMNSQNTLGALEKVLNGLEKTYSREASQHMLADVLFATLVQKLIPRRGGGMVMACEIIMATPPIRSLIRDGKMLQMDSVVITSRKDGMISMKKSLEELVQRGEVRPEDLY